MLKKSDKIDFILKNYAYIVFQKHSFFYDSLLKLIFLAHVAGFIPLNLGWTILVGGHNQAFQPFKGLQVIIY